MPSRSYEEISRDLKNKVYHPVYFLQGEEPFYIDKIADYITEHVLDASEKEFNQTVVYGREADPLSIISTAKRYPMMSNYQVVMVKEAQDIKNLLGKDKDKEEKSPLQNYIENPLKSTVLVFCYKYKTIDKRTKTGKSMEKFSQFFTSEKLYDNKIPDWIIKYVKDKGCKISEKASLLLGEYLGNDLSKVANELDKLSINYSKDVTIDVQHVEQHVGISKDFNTFELQSAIGNKNILKANRIVRYFQANPKNNPLVVTMGTLFSFFNKLIMFHSLKDKSKGAVASTLGINPFFTGDYEKAAVNYPLSKCVKIISLLREYDLKSKGVENVSTTEGELLKELVYKIMH